jgi:hypothetical protein
MFCFYPTIQLWEEEEEEGRDRDDMTGGFHF